MSTQLNNLDWLEEWYANQCNGEWEHSWGIEIDTIDNPGWSIAIPLNDTYLESRSLDVAKVDRTDNDWFHVWVRDRKFEGAGGARNLNDLIQAFRDFAERR
jgi:hypothetical protein